MCDSTLHHIALCASEAFKPHKDEHFEVNTGILAVAEVQGP